MYLAEGEPKGSQIFVRWVDVDGPATQVTRVLETPRNARWSPDGKSIAFSMFVPEQEKWSISMPAEPEGRQVDAGAARRQHDALPSGSGRIRRRRVHPPVRRPRRRRDGARLTPGQWSVGAGELRGGASIDWTPDSKAIRRGRHPHRRRRHEIPGVAALRRRGRERHDPRSRGEGRQLGTAGRVARWQAGGLHRLRADRALRTR
jgi:hypothetical protein